MTDSRPEIKAEATADGEFVRLKMSKQHEGFPAVEYEFLLSREEAMNLGKTLWLEASRWNTGSIASVQGTEQVVTNIVNEHLMPLGILTPIKPKTWRDREPML